MAQSVTSCLGLGLGLWSGVQETGEDTWCWYNLIQHRTSQSHSPLYSLIQWDFWPTLCLLFCGFRGQVGRKIIFKGDYTLFPGLVCV
jgi:hypothetical protein